MMAIHFIDTDGAWETAIRLQSLSKYSKVSAMPYWLTEGELRHLANAYICLYGRTHSKKPNKGKKKTKRKP